MSEEKKQDSPRIAGCSFSIYPMSDNFVDLILSSIDKADTSKVWMKTDEVSTIVRGRIPHIFDVTQAIFLEASRSGKHVVYSSTFSVGCPGDTEGHVFMAEDDVTMNSSLIDEIDQDASAKFALYPMGGGNYMEPIYEQIQAMKSHNVEVELTHYETKLFGKAQDIFRGLQSVLQAMEDAGSPHTVMTVTVSANSPSKRS
ncbi:MAG: thiamine-binding protein [Balneolaceae bacterium]|nr:thiamine-binding protein [Balneolaceae bacterium]MCH8548822.1 Ykof family thiamine-binding protein [Balneolaceae bacterium]